MPRRREPSKKTFAIIVLALTGCAASTGGLQPHSSQPVDPLALVVGATYRLSSPSPGTPLMPRLDPIGVEDLLAVRYIPAGGTMTILQTAKQRHPASIYPWYFVNAESSGGFDLGTGWVNSMALLDQDLAHVCR